MKLKTTIGILIFGIWLGWLLGLVQQAAQKEHRQNCPACSEVRHED